MGVDLIAMHGWGGDHRSWAPWDAAAAERGWRLSCGERGYGRLTPRLPSWGGAGERVVLVHSLGLHLLPAELLEQATALVLLASFGRFVPQGRPGRRLQQALQGMAAQLEAGDAEAEAMLRQFLTEAAAPAPPEWLPHGPLEDGLSAEGRQRLHDDLALLGRTDGLPDGFPGSARVLIVEAAEDRIVAPESRALLRSALPQAEVLTLEGVGHSLLSPTLIPAVLHWIETHAAGGHGQG